MNTQKKRKKKSCYNCQHYALCRLRDRASDFSDYINATGNRLTSEFREKLFKLMGSLCHDYKKEEEEKEEE